MKAYYNEIDPRCAAWLRNLIAENLIEPGDVDTRDICDVRPSDLKGYDQCHFFAGIGGWSYALRRANWPADRKVWTGSCPCQPFSAAGKRGGFADERHLWPYWHYLIEQCRPATIFGEQVASASQWLRLVRSDLEAVDYAVGCMPIQAASAGADHLRDRYWFVANPTSEGSFPGAHPGIHREQESSRARDGKSQRRSGVGQADANEPRPQGRLAECECADKRLIGPGGMANSDLVSEGEGRLQRSGQFGGSGGDSETCRSGNLGDSSGAACERNTGSREDRAVNGDCSVGPTDASASAFEWVIGADGKARRVKPGLRLLAHGIPGRVGLLRGYGNAIDPRPASEFILASMEALKL